MNYNVPLILLTISIALYFLLSPAPPLSDEELKTHLKDKVVLICGASSGIGEQLAYQLAGHGAKLALVARSQDKLDRVKEESLKRGAPDVMTISFDFSDVAGSSGVVTQTVEKFGGLDYLVSNHGAMLLGPYLASPSQHNPAYVERIFRVNLFSHIELVLHALPHLEANKGHMFFTSSMAGEAGLYSNGVYSSTKHAMNGFFYSLQQELLAKESPVSLTIGAFGLILTKDLFEILASSTDVLDDMPDLFKGSVDECARGMMEAYITRPRTMTYPRIMMYVFRANWYFNPYFHEMMLQQDKPKGVQGTGYQEGVEKMVIMGEKAQEMGYQQGHSGEPSPTE